MLEAFSEYQNPDKKDYDVFSVPGFVMKRVTSVVPSMEFLHCNKCTLKPEMLQKARQPKHGGHKTILEWCQKYDKYRTSLSEIGWTEE